MGIGDWLKKLRGDSESLDDLADSVEDPSTVAKDEWMARARQVVDESARPVNERSPEIVLATILPVSSIAEVPEAVNAMAQAPHDVAARLRQRLLAGELADWSAHATAIFLAGRAAQEGELDGALEAPIVEALRAVLPSHSAPMLLPEAAIDAVHGLPETERASAVVAALTTIEPRYGSDLRWSLLAEHPSKEALAVAKRLLPDVHERLAHRVLEAFGRYAGGAEELAEVFDPEHASAPYFVRAMQVVGTADVVPSLATAVELGDTATRTQAVRVLKTMQEVAEPEVLELLGHSRKGVRLAAAEILQKWRRSAVIDDAVRSALDAERTADVRTLLELIEPPPPGEANARTYEETRKSMDKDIGLRIESATDDVREGGDGSEWRELAAAHPAWFAVRVGEAVAGRLVAAEPAVATWLRAMELVGHEPVTAWASARVFTKLKSLYSRGTANLPELRQRLFEAHAAQFGQAGLAPFVWLFQTRDVPGAGHLMRMICETYEDAPAQLSVLLEHDDADVRVLVADALGSLGAAAVPALVEVLGAKQKDTRVAAAYALGLTESADAIEPLEARFEKERTNDVKAAIQEALSALRLADGPNIGSMEATAENHERIDDMLADVPAEPTLTSFEELPRISWSTGAPLSDGARRWLVARLEQLSYDDEDELLLQLRDHLDPQTSRELLSALREQFDEESKERRIGWLLYATAVLGGESDFFDLGSGLDEVARFGSSEQAFRTLDVFGQSATPAGIHWLDHYSRRAKSAGLRDRSKQWLHRVAERHGVSADELLEATMDDFGLDDRGRTTFAFGEREVVVKFDAAGEVGVERADGTVNPRFPGQRVDDPEDEYLAVRDAYRAFRKTLKRVMTAQHDRLEHAMGARRAWTYAQFEATMMTNIVLFEIARNVLWLAETDDGPAVLRLCDDRSWATSDDDEFTRPIETLFVAHPLDFPDDVEAWAEVFNDYYLTPPFPIFDRDVYRVPEESVDGYSINTFRDLLAVPLRNGLENRRWDRTGSDMGVFLDMYKEYGPIEAIISLDPGLSVIRDPDEPDQDVVLQFFEVESTKGIPLANVHPVTISEAMRDLAAIPSRSHGR